MSLFGFVHAFCWKNDDMFCCFKIKSIVERRESSWSLLMYKLSGAMALYF